MRKKRRTTVGRATLSANYLVLMNLALKYGCTTAAQIDEILGAGHGENLISGEYLKYSNKQYAENISKFIIHGMKRSGYLNGKLG